MHPTSNPSTQAHARARRDAVPRWVLDLLLGIAVSLVIAIVITADQGGIQDPDALAYLFAGGFGVLMLGRRRFPVAVLLLTMLLLFAYYSLGYPAIGLAVPVAAALYSAAELGKLTAAIVVSLLLIVVSTSFRIAEGQAIAYLLGYELVSTLTLMAAAIALGDSTRARRALRAEQEQTAQLIAQEHRRRAEQQIQTERMRMARDLHDLIGHTISVISLQADVANEAIGNDDEQAHVAVGHIRTVSAEAMQELRATVKLLRTPDREAPGGQSRDREPTPRAVTSLTNLAMLVDHARASGLAVDVEVEGEIATLPPTVDMAAYRIIQESLTNIIRHAHASEVALSVVVAAGELRLHVVDDGGARTDAVNAGSGIAGMRERARLLGGTLTAAARPTGGFAVSATLPWQEET